MDRVGCSHPDFSFMAVTLKSATQGEKVSGTSHEEIKISPRERQIARRVARGLSNKEIASELGISHGTVGTYMTRIFQKLNVRTRAAMVAKLLRAGHLVSRRDRPE